MKEKYCTKCKAMAKDGDYKVPICEAATFLGSQTSYLEERRDLVQNYQEWLGSFIRFLAKLRVNYHYCPNKKFRKNIYSAESAVGKTKR